MADKNQNEDQMPNVRFTVMPDLEGIGKIPTKATDDEINLPSDYTAPSPGTPSTPPNKPPIPPSVPHSSAPIPPSVPQKSHLTGDLHEYRTKTGADGRSGFRRNFKKIILTALIIIVVAVGGAFAFNMWQDRQSQIEAENQTQNQNQNQQTGNTNLNTDSDNDGMTDIEELNLGTDPNHPDTDNDGIADGDEVAHFNTSPLSIHSDADRYDDGKELRDGYSPLVGGDARLSEQEINNIIALLSNNMLHQPTINTLLRSTFWQEKVPHLIGSNPDFENGEVFVYEDSVYGYQLTLPGSWRRTGENPTNLVFIENGSPTARYVQIQAFVGVDEQGQISSNSLVESEIARLTNIAIAGVDVRQTTINGLPAHRLAAESERGSSGSSTATLLTATVEYIVDTSTAAFLITVSCTSDSGQSCMLEAQQLAQSIEVSFRF